jgi:pyruvate kinase
VLADLQGPKLRIGQFAGAGQCCRPDRCSRSTVMPPLATSTASACRILNCSRPSSRDSLLIDDGKLRLQVDSSEGDAIRTRVVVAWSPTARASMCPMRSADSALTAKDRRDLDFALEMGADWIALSFVAPRGCAGGACTGGGARGHPLKLEKPAALERLGEIVAVSTPSWWRAATRRGAAAAGACRARKAHPAACASRASPS